MDTVTFALSKRYVDAVTASSAKIYGVQWTKVASPNLTRIQDSVGMAAAAGVDGGLVTNNFDTAQIYREIGQVVDTLGNVFIRIPKFYIRKTTSTVLRTWEVSKYQYPGFYLPACFWDFTNNRELPYVDIGKYKATSDGSNRLESKSGGHPLINQTIVTFRDRARNNNTGGLQGYQQLDIHTHDLLQTLMTIEFATLNLQSIMQGFTTGQYLATHTAVLTETGVNRAVLPNAQADLYRVGQAISVGTTLGGNQVFYGRNITEISVVDASNKALVFDGAPVNIAAGNIVYNTAWCNGFSSAIAASSGSIVSNSDGKYPCVYRGIESPYGDMWRFVDGVNINERQAWVTPNANDYTSNVFAAPYEQLSYANGSTDGYVAAMGHDALRPFAEFPTAVGGSSSTFYADYYYQTTGQRIALVGGGWSLGASAGPWCWFLSNASSAAGVPLGGRLLKKAL